MSSRERFPMLRNAVDNRIEDRLCDDTTASLSRPRLGSRLAGSFASRRSPPHTKVTSWPMACQQRTMEASFRGGAFVEKLRPPDRYSMRACVKEATFSSLKTLVSMADNNQSLVHCDPSAH